jgi:uncharacterized protein
MLFFVYLKDKPDSVGLRISLRALHLAYMAANEKHILIGGPLASAAGKRAEGSLLVVDFPDLKSVHIFLDLDPYHVSGLFIERTVRFWCPVRVSNAALKRIVEQNSELE